MEMKQQYSHGNVMHVKVFHIIHINVQLFIMYQIEKKLLNNIQYHQIKKENIYREENRKLIDILKKNLWLKNYKKQVLKFNKKIKIL